MLETLNTYKMLHKFDIIIYNSIGMLQHTHILFNLAPGMLIANITEIIRLLFELLTPLLSALSAIPLPAILSAIPLPAALSAIISPLASGFSHSKLPCSSAQ